MPSVSGSLLLYGRAVAILGASGGAAFGALVPALSALIAIPLLREWPSDAEWAGIALISAGVYRQAEDRCPAGASRRAVRRLKRTPSWIAALARWADNVAIVASSPYIRRLYPSKSAERKAARRLSIRGASIGQSPPI
jgi:hypothetical protein